MSTSNLPPGCRESDIPGNSAADAAWERLMDYAHDELSTLEIDEARRAIIIGIAAVEAERREINKAVEIAVHDRLEIMREDAIRTEEIAMEGAQ